MGCVKTSSPTRFFILFRQLPYTPCLPESSIKKALQEFCLFSSFNNHSLPARLLVNTFV